jgi:hypothetical protein
MSPIAPARFCNAVSAAEAKEYCHVDFGPGILRPRYCGAEGATPRKSRAKERGMTACFSRRAAPLDAPGAGAPLTADPSGSAAFDSLKRGERGRNRVLWKICGTEKFPFLPFPCRNHGFWVPGPWNGAEQGGKGRNGAEHQNGGGEIAAPTAPATPLPRRTPAGRPGGQLRNGLRNLPKNSQTKNL